MKLENQYCTRLQALRLKELGVSNIAVTVHGDDDDDDDDVNYLLVIPNTCISFTKFDNVEEICLVGSKQKMILSRFSEPVKLYSAAELMRMYITPSRYLGINIQDISIAQEMANDLISIMTKHPERIDAINEQLNRD